MICSWKKSHEIGNKMRYGPHVYLHIMPHISIPYTLQQSWQWKIHYVQKITGEIPIETPFRADFQLPRLIAGARIWCIYRRLLSEGSRKYHPRITIDQSSLGQFP